MVKVEVDYPDPPQAGLSFDLRHKPLLCSEESRPSTIIHHYDYDEEVCSQGVHLVPDYLNLDIADIYIGGHFNLDEIIRSFNQRRELTSLAPIPSWYMRPSECTVQQVRRFLQNERATIRTFILSGALIFSLEEFRNELPWSELEAMEEMTFDLSVVRPRSSEGFEASSTTSPTYRWTNPIRSSQEQVCRVMDISIIRPCSDLAVDLSTPLYTAEDIARGLFDIGGPRCRYCVQCQGCVCAGKHHQDLPGEEQVFAAIENAHKQLPAEKSGAYDD